MTTTSGPPQPTTVADLRARQQDRTTSAMGVWERQQLTQAIAFGHEFASALRSELSSTHDAIRADQTQLLSQLQRDQAAVQTASQRLSRSARAAARMWWLPTAAVAIAVVGLSLMFALWKVTAATQLPAATQTVTKKGQSWEVLTGPTWTTCQYDRKTRPCRPVKE